MPLDKSTSHYQGEAGTAYHLGKRSIPAEATPWVAQLRKEKLAPHVRSHDVVLEYGVGFGWNLQLLQCAAKLGYDISDHLAEPLEKAGIPYIRNLESLDPGSIHLIICHHALEHIPDPMEALTRMHRLLVPGGKLLLFVPYEKERRYQGFDPAEPNHHLFSWNPQTLGNLVSDAGFKVASAGLGRFGYDRFSAKLAVRLKIGQSGFRVIQNLAHLLRPASEVRLVAQSIAG